MAGEMESVLGCTKSTVCFLFSGQTHGLAGDCRHNVDRIPPPSPTRGNESRDSPLSALFGREPYTHMKATVEKRIGSRKESLGSCTFLGVTLETEEADFDYTLIESEAHVT